MAKINCLQLRSVCGVIVGSTSATLVTPIQPQSTIPPDGISEVSSHRHVVLQCLDIVLGAMTFRLNDKHLEKPEGSRLRAKKTIAKEKLYKLINTRIREIYPHFNIGVSTNAYPLAQRWEHPYRHWVFTPAEFEIDASAVKSRK